MKVYVYKLYRVKLKLNSLSLSLSLSLLGCVNNQVRLVDGAVPSQGRVEVCLDQQWGTVCDDDWDTTDVNILCKQLGYSRFSKIMCICVIATNNM